MVNVNIIGRLGADAELVNGKNGQFISFRMAVDDRKNNEKITTWFKVNFYSDRSAKLAEYLTKGKLINVVGTETVGTYSAKDGSTQISRDVVASNIEFVSVGSGGTSSDTTVETKEDTEVTTGKLEKPVVAKATVANEPEDDLPF